MNTSDWRTQLQPDTRQRIIDKIIDTLKKHLRYSGQEGLHELEKIAVRFEEKIYNAAISQQQQQREQQVMAQQSNLSNMHQQQLGPQSSVTGLQQPQQLLGSTAQTGHADGGDWKEEAYQKIKSLNDLYFADMNEMSRKIAVKLQQHDSLQQPKTEQLEKLRLFKAMLDKSLAFLQLNKNSILIGHKDKLPLYEKQIVSFVSSNRPRRPASSLQQGQLVLTDHNNWRPIQSGEPTMDTSDWRSQLQPDSRQKIINKIMDTLKKNLPYSGQEGLHELEKVAVRFEEKIYNAAISQSDYLRKISLKMLSVETTCSNTMADSLPSNTVGTSSKTPDPGNVFKRSLRVRRKKHALKRVKKSRDPKGSML
ncbi:mediator of RNA polymerase II transcription subunit 15a-like isoform X2 [Ziziphus jujuba]|uniref:Mediator of RNA polymerase II transcription subunit 15a-like isoform X2 n=1 Tax=Ziziphus jujuba TaxID=326968 RepID=A0ABM3ZZ53_ZIZJJ|nr:mediator of RNA polymerase II transcription subunit 15a-like isoform X2 [Ziziphus jujuba]